MAKKYKHCKQKNFSVNNKPQTVLQVKINMALASGDPIPYDIAVEDAKKRSEKIPEEIKEEARQRFRAGDLSVWEDERLMKYVR